MRQLIFFHSVCFVALFFSFGLPLHAQQAKADSLLSILPKSTDSVYIYSCCEIAEAYIEERNLSFAFNYIDSALIRSRRSGQKKQEAYTYNCAGNLYNYLTDVKKAISSFDKALSLYQEIKYTPGECSVYLNKGNTYFNSGEYRKAEKSYQKALDTYFLKPDDDRTEADIYNNLGSVCGAQAKYEEAKRYFEKAVAINRKNNDYISISYGYNNIASVFDAQGKTREALPYFKEALDLKLKYGDNVDKADAYRNLGECYNNLSDYRQAIDCFKKALPLTDTSVYNNKLTSLYNSLAGGYEQNNDHKEASRYYKLAKELSEKQFRRELAEHIEQSDRLTEFTKSHLSDSLSQAVRIAGQQQEIRRSSMIRYFLFSIIALVAIFFILLYKRYRVSESQKKEIHRQKELVEEKQKEIVDSITYTKRLQDAILPPAKMVQQLLPESFIYYRPKDIVAGDFYWLEQKDGLLFIAAADCTGHGVPGAMVSMVCSNALNSAVNEFGLRDTAAILNKAREIILDTFSKSESEVKDGMDISVCALNRLTLQLNWSGANNPLWYMSEGTFYEAAPDKQSVGKNEQHKDFTSHTIQLKKGDVVYLFTDGYADQFGGEKGKKFKYKALKELLLSVHAKPMDLQKETIERTFTDWKGKLEQVDDVCIIGFRL